VTASSEKKWSFPVPDARGCFSFIANAAQRHLTALARRDEEID
jgi:hypothetical protein